MHKAELQQNKEEPSDLRFNGPLAAKDNVNSSQSVTLADASRRVSTDETEHIRPEECRRKDKPFAHECQFHWITVWTKQTHEIRVWTQCHTIQCWCKQSAGPVHFIKASLLCTHCKVNVLKQRVSLSLSKSSGSRDTNITSVSTNQAALIFHSLHFRNTQSSTLTSGGGTHEKKC